MRNLEWKAELLDADLARALLQRCGAAWIETIDLRDTHYKLAEGRLLRRDADFRPVQWFKYTRPTSITPAISEVEVFSDAQATLRFGAVPPPVFAQVEMRREMWLSGRVRINIDRVAWHGAFIELEARLSPSITPRIAAAMLRGVRRCVGPAIGEPIAHSYSELAQRRAAMCLSPDDENALEAMFVNPNHARPA